MSPSTVISVDLLEASLVYSCKIQLPTTQWSLKKATGLEANRTALSITMARCVKCYVHSRSEVISPLLMRCLCHKEVTTFEWFPYLSMVFLYIKTRFNNKLFIYISFDVMVYQSVIQMWFQKHIIRTEASDICLNLWDSISSNLFVIYIY